MADSPETHGSGPRLPGLAVALIAAGALSYQVLLMRLYAIVQWHHFAFMVISIALLGFGASGTLLTLVRGPALARFRRVFAGGALGFGLLAVAAFALAQRLPVNPMELAWRPVLFGRVALVYLLLMGPFLCAGLCIGLAFSRFGHASGRLYRFDLTGSGLGAAGMIGALWLLDAPAALRLMPLLGALAAAAVVWPRSRAGAAGLAALGLAAALALPATWIAPQVSQYKDLSRALDRPEAEILARQSNPAGRVSVVASPARPFRHAPGLSLNSPTSPGDQLGLFVDATLVGAIARFDGDPARVRYLDWMPSAAAYQVLERPAVLVLGLGGGRELLRARRLHDARRVDAAEINPAIPALLRGRFAGYSGDLLAPPDVRAHVADGRAFVAGADRRWDLIQLPPRGAAGGGAAGLGGLSETYASTLEAFETYLAHLSDGGILSVTRRARTPPRGTLKAALTAIRALERRGVDRPGQHLVLLRGWDRATLLVKAAAPFAPAEIDALKAFAEARSFDSAHYPGMPRAQANRFNVLDEPYFHDGMQALLGPERARYLERYKFDLRPSRDDRPYFFDMAKWSTLPELLSIRAKGGMPLIEWGAIVLLATLVQAAALAALLILAPLAVLRRSSGSRVSGRGAVAAYFLALGLGFLFVEIALIKQLTLFLGHPLYAVALVLAAFLVFAGLGSGCARRLDAWAGARGLRPVDLAAGAILVLGGLTLAGGDLVTAAAMGWPAWAKVPVALGLLAPLALAMGLPFPLAIARLAGGAPALVPWAWAVNGCASVVGSVLAALIAMQAGFTVVIALALALYLMAALAERGLPALDAGPGAR